MHRSIRLPIPEVLVLDTMVTAAGRLAWHGVGPALVWASGSYEG
ncbi:MAG: hypothetical protein ABGY41_13570 [Candidatus Poribacteria bacterium]